MKKKEFYDHHFNGKPNVPSWKEYCERVKNAKNCCTPLHSASANFKIQKPMPKENFKKKESEDKQFYISDKFISISEKITEIIDKPTVNNIKSLGLNVKNWGTSSSDFFDYLSITKLELILSKKASKFFLF
jgi:hypothetical protein